METEIYYLPEFFYWDGYTPTAVGCTYGGIFDFNLSEDGIKYLFNFEGCEFIANFRMTGTGRYNPNLDRFVLNVTTTGRWSCELNYIRDGEKIRMNGQCNGNPIRVVRDLTDQAKH